MPRKDTKGSKQTKKKSNLEFTIVNDMSLNLRFRIVNNFFMYRKNISTKTITIFQKVNHN